VARRGYDLVIVGLGSAGLVAADLAAHLGLKVAAVERDRIGGDCLWGGCVPSKALLASARAAHAMRTADRFGLTPVEPLIDTKPVLERIRRIQHDIERSDDNPELLAAKGVDVHFGAARLVGPRTVDVEGVGELHARFVLLCTGSRPAIPEVPGLSEAGYLTSETFWDQERLPESIVTIGGGPVGVELSQACARLGVRTTLLQHGERLLPREEPALADRLGGLLRCEGVEVVTDAHAHGVAVEAGEKVVRATVGEQPREWRAQQIVVGAGRAPNVEGLGLGEQGIEVNDRGVVVDGALRTSVRSVYAAGDLAGRFLFTHTAGYEGGVAVRNMFFPARSKATELVPWCTFTDPELAHVGPTEAEARERFGTRARVWRYDLAESDRARTDDATEGEIRILTVRGKIVGAHLLAPNAGDLIGELTLAIDRGKPLRDLATLVHVYPTRSLAFAELGGQASYELADRFGFLVRSRPWRRGR